MSRQSSTTVVGAPGKIILFGEHAVVYGRPAIAVPVTQVRAMATVADAPAGTGIVIRAQDLGREHVVGAPTDEQTEPLEMIVRLTLEHLGVRTLPHLLIAISSTIPIGSGMGSSAAVSASVTRALAQHMGASLSDAEVSSLVYETEILHHGTPSGIDNTVVSYAKPVYFCRGEELDTIQVGRPFTVVVGDTGIFSPTKVAVGDVRAAWEADKARYEQLFDAIGEIAARARTAIVRGETSALGPLMDDNQELLRRIQVSSPELERLIASAKEAGAAGAKLCGAGRGGNMIALVTGEVQGRVVDALLSAGAHRVLVSEVS